MPEFYTGKIEEPYTPFSNGEEARSWYAHNCERCTKAWHPDGEKGPPDYKTQKQYVTIGKYCRFQYWMDIGFITGEIPKHIADQMGIIKQDSVFTGDCIHFSDNDDDRFKYPKRPAPDKTPGNQLTMPFIFDELGIKKHEPQLV